MNNIQFNQIAKKTLNLIVDAIEESDTEGLIDIDFNNDVLTINTSQGIFVINKQPTTKEIWLASPISGPYHFMMQGDRWHSKNGEELYSLLSKELQITISN
jgi:iron donor protein CyaY